MGKYKIHRVTPLHQGKQHNPNLLSNAVSHGRWATRGASNAERESVSSSIRVGDWDVSRQGGMRCLKTFSIARQSALYEHARLPAAARCTSTGRSFVVVESYNSAADPDASAARYEGPSVHNSKSQSPKEE
ncbi:hypothetical protein TcCL_Unassigned00847 [Trypanosoma cruzi]|nr:hypothetical protein TcCL_Unassigned00847 [Trypanosoma cruzi]